MQSCCFRLCISDASCSAVKKNKKNEIKQLKAGERLVVIDAPSFRAPHLQTEKAVCVFSSSRCTFWGMRVLVRFQVGHLEKHPCFQVTADLNQSP